MLELLFGKAGALKGEFHDGSAFGRGDDQAESVRKIGYESCSFVQFTTLISLYALFVNHGFDLRQ